MIVFWVAAGVLAAAAGGLVLFRAAAAGRETASDPTPLVYRRQLAEIDELAERGLIGEPERKSAYAEAARRLLGAADTAPTGWSANDESRKPVLLTVLAACAAALAVYVVVGQPGMEDQPFAERLHRWRETDPATLSPPELAAVLQQLTRQRPDDPQAWRFLAIAEGAAQDPSEAVRAMRHAVRLAPERADLWELFGQALVAQADGEVTPEAQDAFRQAVKRDPKAVAARFHLARAQIASGDKAGGLAAWRALLAELPANDPRRQDLTAAIAEAEGKPVSVAPAFSQSQLAMIQGMVQSLAEKLKAHPDDPRGWIRLVRAYAVLGEKSKLNETLTEAKARYAGNRDTLAQLDAAARAEAMP